VKKSEVVIGKIYIAKISGRFSRVRLDREYKGYTNRSGWDGTNLDTNRSVRIKSAAKLRHEVQA
jgi:hypothetical protein